MIKLKEKQYLKELKKEFHISEEVILLIKRTKTKLSIFVNRRIFIILVKVLQN